MSIQNPKTQQQSLCIEQMEHLTELSREQNKKEVKGFLIVIGGLFLLILVLYVVFREHCFIDLPLLILLLIISVLMAGMILYKNRKLCERIEGMLEERRTDA